MDKKNVSKPTHSQGSKFKKLSDKDAKKLKGGGLNLGKDKPGSEGGTPG